MNSILGHDQRSKTAKNSNPRPISDLRWHVPASLNTIRDLNASTLDVFEMAFLFVLQILLFVRFRKVRCALQDADKKSKVSEFRTTK
jgi:hypothetical protein